MSAANIARWGLVLLALGVAGYAAEYLWLEPEAFAFVVQRATYAELQSMLILHVGAGCIALAVGAVQWFPALRRYRHWHRRLGASYVGAVVVSAVTAFPVAHQAYGGVANSAAFWLLAMFWLVTTFRAVWHIRRGERIQHRAWMYRSYALTFAAVTLRAELGLLIGVGGLSLDGAYQIVPWTSWVLNLLFVEWVLIARLYPRPADRRMPLQRPIGSRVRP